MTVRRLDALLAEAMSRPSVHSARIIGVDGPGGSGKSTLARRLAALAGAPIVKMDDFVSWDDFAGWWPRFDAELLGPLVGGGDVRYQVRDWLGDEFGSSLREWKTVPSAPLVIVEGVTSTCRAAGDRVTYRIWVEAPQPLRLERGLRRDGDDHRELWARWMRDEAAFFAADDTRARADLRVDGDPSVAHDPATEVVAAR